MKRKDRARSPPTTRNIPELGISESIPLTEYFPFPELTPLAPGARPQGVLPTVVSPGAIWAQVEPGLESEALLANCALS
jgi:hypothetical protein